MKRKSIIIFIIILILLIFGVGFLVLKKSEIKKQEHIKKQQVEEEMQKNTIKARVWDFYDKYIAIVNEITTRERNDKQLTYKSRDLALGDFVSDDFREKILSGGNLHSDPVLCAQDIPTCIRVEVEEVEIDKATALTHQYFSGKTCQMNPEWDNTVEVKLRLDENKWKIYDVVCSNN